MEIASQADHAGSIPVARSKNLTPAFTGRRFALTLQRKRSSYLGSHFLQSRTEVRSFRIQTYLRHPFSFRSFTEHAWSMLLN